MGGEAREALKETDSSADLWIGINVLFVKKRDIGRESVHEGGGLAELPRSGGETVDFR